MPSQSGEAKLEMRAIPLITLLHAVAGSVDAIAYLLCGHYFVANMTGATVMLAIALLGRDRHDALVRALLIVSFLSGVLLGRLMARATRGDITQGQRVVVLLIEAVVLLMLSLRTGTAHTHVLLVGLAAVLGMQNTTFQRFGGLQVNTAFITGDLEKLGQAILTPGGHFPSAVIFAICWGAYATGAFLGALGTHGLGMHAFLIPTVLVLAALLMTLLRPEQF
jgi:uncharacterized membrane protein YoaK (UPF0700 family)